MQTDENRTVPVTRSLLTSLLLLAEENCREFANSHAKPRGRRPDSMTRDEWARHNAMRAREYAQRAAFYQWLARGF